MSLSLAPDEIHVWFASLDSPPVTVEALDALLSPDERDRATCFRFAHHRTRFVVGRGMLRAILSRYLEMPSARIRFEYGEHGKPDLPAPSRLRFNLSHSEGWAVYAVSLVEVGVDIQAIGRSQDHAAVAGRFFSAREVAELEALPRPEAERAFAACWARKEAYIKARGAGLKIPLSTFDIRGDRRGGDWMAVSGEDTDGWHVRALPSADSYEGAIAARDTARVLRFCEWSSL